MITGSCPKKKCRVCGSLGGYPRFLWDAQWPWLSVIYISQKPYRLLGETRKPLPMWPSNCKSRFWIHPKWNMQYLYIYKGIRKMATRDRPATNQAKENRYLLDKCMVDILGSLNKEPNTYSKIVSLYYFPLPHLSALSQ